MSETQPTSGPASPDDAVTGDERPVAEPARPAITPHAGLIYGAMRLGLLLAVGGLLWVAGLRGWLWVLVTALASAVASWFLLVRQREAAARNLEATLGARHARPEARDDDTGPDGAQTPE